VNVRNLLAAVTLGGFFVLISLFFVGVPWSSDTHDVPLFGPGGSLANDLFTTYAVTLILIALLLSSAMIGGVYLAKMEEKP